MLTNRLGRRRWAALALAASVAIILAACSATSPGGAGGGGASGAAPDSAELLSTAYEGVVDVPPTDPVPVPPGLTAWVVSCGEVSLTCSTPAAGAVEAAKQIGWDASVCDGQLNPDGWSACIRQGIAAQADVVITVGQDCPAISGALQEAKSAGITTANIGGVDCNPGLFSATVDQIAALPYEEYWKKVGQLQADWLIGKTEGKATLLDVQFNDTVWGPLINDGLKSELSSKCPDCEIAGSVQLSNADIASGSLVQKFSTALLQNPTVNAVAVPIDGWFLVGLAQAINGSGRNDTLSVIGNSGTVANDEIIRTNGGEDATVYTSSAWQGWASIDTALRTLAGQKVLPGGVGLQVVDAATNLPKEGAEFAYTPAVDFRAAYLDIWKK